MIDCLRTRVHKQPIVALYFELDNELKVYSPRPGRGNGRGNVVQLVSVCETHAIYITKLNCSISFDPQYI